MGRRPIFGRPMTAAERKRRGRGQPISNDEPVTKPQSYRDTSESLGAEKDREITRLKARIAELEATKHTYRDGPCLSKEEIEEWAERLDLRPQDMEAFESAVGRAQVEIDLHGYINHPDMMAEWLVREIGILESHDLADAIHEAADAADEAECAAEDEAKAKSKDDSVT
jgi:hypothetical protein